MKLAIEIWKRHIEVFESFDLLCVSNNLEEETKSTALFSALVTLRMMSNNTDYSIEYIKQAKDYLKASRYYSDSNKDSDH